MDPNGNPSNEDRTLVDHGYVPAAPPRPALPDPPPSAYTNGVVTPHAAFLACATRPRRRSRTCAGWSGLPRPLRRVGLPRLGQRRHRRASDFYLSLDQGMVMAAIGNALGGDMLREAFVVPATERRCGP